MGCLIGVEIVTALIIKTGSNPIPRSAKPMTVYIVLLIKNRSRPTEKQTRKRYEPIKKNTRHVIKNISMLRTG